MRSFLKSLENRRDRITSWFIRRGEVMLVQQYSWFATASGMPSTQSTIWLLSISEEVVCLNFRARFEERTPLMLASWIKRDKQTCPHISKKYIFCHRRHNTNKRIPKLQQLRTTKLWTVGTPKRQQRLQLRKFSCRNTTSTSQPKRTLSFQQQHRDELPAANWKTKNFITSPKEVQR